MENSEIKQEAFDASKDKKTRRWLFGLALLGVLSFVAMVGSAYLIFAGQEEQVIAGSNLADQVDQACDDLSFAREYPELCDRATDVKEIISEGPRGIPGIPGAEGPPGPPGQSIVGPRGQDGQSIVGPPGPRGRDGRSIVGPEGPPGESITGPEGNEGAAGENATPDMVDAAVFRYCVSRNECQGPKGEKGDPGESIVGPPGPAGTVTPGSYRCPDGEFMVGLDVALDGSIVLACIVLPVGPPV